MKTTSFSAPATSTTYTSLEPVSQTQSSSAQSQSQSLLIKRGLCSVEVVKSGLSSASRVSARLSGDGNKERANTADDAAQKKAQSMYFIQNLISRKRVWADYLKPGATSSKVTIEAIPDSSETPLPACELPAGFTEPSTDLLKYLTPWLRSQVVEQGALRSPQRIHPAGSISDDAAVDEQQAEEGPPVKKCAVPPEQT
ncbi:hypothetical protein ACVBEF_03515 [Glaciimonas sp. GG7]